ncbi:MAG: enoyl-CoA hydratase/isomerase family protein [Acidimicrobiia bacterium]|nr:enoyl-CoA hydratase/isomerase family protein [Acidimicrobiia bacterium]
MSMVQKTIEGAVALVELQRPPVNALSGDLAAELSSVFNECRDPAIRAVVVTGRPHFAAGADIKGFQESFDAGADGKLAPSVADAVADLEALEKPTIAAVHGFALGGGLELAMGADFRYLAEDARVGQPEINLGIIPGAGGTQRLPRLIGFQAAKELVYSGRHVEPSEALDLGIADRVHPANEVLDRAMADAAEWAKGPTLALAAAKRALAGGWGAPLQEGLSVEAEAFATAFGTADAREGVAAFIEKRTPEFKGN